MATCLPRTMATNLPSPQVCHNCWRKNRPMSTDKVYKRCSGCHLLSYCDPQCQEEHWIKVHKKQCKVIAGAKELSYTVHGDDCVTCINHKTETIKMKTEEQAKAGTPLKVNVPCMADETVMRVTNGYLKQFGIMENKSMKLKAPFRFGELGGEYLPSKYDEHFAHMWNILQVIRKIYFVQHFSKKNNSDLLAALEDHIINQRAKLWKLYTVFGNCPMVNSGMNHVSLFNVEVLTMMKEVDAVIGPMAMGMKQSKITHKQWWSLFLFHIDGLVNFSAKQVALTDFTPNCFEGNTYPRLKEHVEKCQDHFQFKTSWLIMGGSKKSQGLPTDLRVPVPSNSSCCICKELITAPFAELYSELLSGASSISDYAASWIKVMKTKFSMSALITNSVQADGGRSFFCSSAQNPRCMESLGAFLIEDSIGLAVDELSALRSVAKFCDNCLRYSLSCHRCSICKSYQYCSEDCLKEDWTKYHKSVCGEMKEKKDKQLPRSHKQKEDRLEKEEVAKIRTQLELEKFRDAFKSGTAEK